MRAELVQLRHDTRAALCAECGKCTAVCPLAAHGGFSARAIACQHLDEELTGQGIGLRRCLTCGSCELRCPQGVRFMDLVRGVRELSPQESAESCPHGGALQGFMRIMSRDGAAQQRLAWLTEDLKTDPAKGDVFLWTGCAVYFDAFFPAEPVPAVDSNRAAIRLLNRLGVTPVVSPEERCCGHDLLWNGDRESFERLARHNVRIVRESGATTLVTACAECLRTWKLDYQPFVGGPPLEVLHLAEFVAARLPQLPVTSRRRRRVTFHDPCRLGRHLALYEAPRKVLSALPGVELAEMSRSGPRAICCAGGTWTHCDRFAKEIQVDRLREARATGADTLVTACPKCRIHFACAMRDADHRDETRIEMRDLAEVLAEALE